MTFKRYREGRLLSDLDSRVVGLITEAGIAVEDLRTTLPEADETVIITLLRALEGIASSSYFYSRLAHSRHYGRSDDTTHIKRATLQSSRVIQS